MVGMLAPEFEEVVTGEAEVREIFRVPRIGAIAGCYVRQRASSPVAPRCASSATARSSGRARSRRCKRFKDDAREVREGFECGIGLTDFQDLKPGDIIETFEEREIARVLDGRFSSSVAHVSSLAFAQLGSIFTCGCENGGVGRGPGTSEPVFVVAGATAMESYHITTRSRSRQAPGGAVDAGRGNGTDSGQRAEIGGQDLWQRATLGFADWPRRRQATR